MSEVKLNKEQKQAIDHNQGALLIVAGAGTGKTTVLTQRVFNLLKKETSFISNGQKRNTGVSYIDIGGPTIFKLQEYLSLREKINSNIINTFSNFFERENESNNNKNNEQNKDGNPDFSLVLKEKLTNLIDFKLIDNEQANSIYSNIANNNDMEKFEILNNIDVNKKEESISILNNYILI